MDGETGAPGLIPSCHFGGIGREVSEGGGVGLGHPSGEKRRMIKNFLIEAVFSKEGNAGVALREGLGVEAGPGGETVFRLGANILEGNN